MVERIAVEVGAELKREFEKALIDRHGHVSGKISPTIRELIKRWIEGEERNSG